MNLYHFCAAHNIKGIRKRGLTLGLFPIIGDEDIRFISACQWLTSEPDPQKQSWATSQHIPYSRTAYRLTINIPTICCNLVKASTFVKHLDPKHRNIVEDWQGSEDWYIYIGSVPPEWIVGVDRT